MPPRPDARRARARRRRRRRKASCYAAPSSLLSPSACPRARRGCAPPSTTCSPPAGLPSATAPPPTTTPRSGGLHPAIWELLSLAAAAALPAAQGVHTLSAHGVGIDGAIPERLGELRTLQRLSLRGNLIRALPPSIGGLPLLEEIDVSGNALASLPPSLWSLPALRVLCADRNAITEIGPEVAAAAGTLETLDLGHNRLSTIPAELGELRRLRYLDLRHNALAAVPPQIVRLLTDAEPEYGRVVSSAGQLTPSVLRDALGGNAAPAEEMLLAAHLAGGLRITVEYCTAPRPSFSLKGDARDYSDAYAAFREAVALTFDGRVDVAANRAPADGASPAPPPPKEAARVSGIGMIKRVGAGQAGRTPLASRSAPSLRDARRPDGRAAARVAVGSRARQPAAPPPPAKPWVPSYGRGVPGEDTRTRPAHLEKGRGQKPGIRFPRLGSFEVLLHSKWRKPTHLHSAIASLTIPSADDLLASLLAFLGQHADYGWLRRADRLLLHTAMRNGDEEGLTRLLAAAPFLVDATDDGGATATPPRRRPRPLRRAPLGAGARAGAFDREARRRCTRRRRAATRRPTRRRCERSPPRAPTPASPTARSHAIVQPRRRATRRASPRCWALVPSPARATKTRRRRPISRSCEGTRGSPGR